LVGAIELVKDKATRARWGSEGEAGSFCRQASLDNDLVMRATGDIMLIAPPLVITKAQIDELIGKARKALDDAHDMLKKEMA
jgi:putrescine aminotransferase